MKEPDFLLFASDATLIGLAGLAMLLLSFVAFMGERRRRNRRDIDAVGVLPWRDIAAFTMLLGMMLMALAISGWLKG
ncbi:MAG: hypothetical protein B7Y88_02540 [Sphingomonadales bacterium 32-64-17]|nr:MAG: hypothetical protein B7Y88_02540 [Sphingomonadales bacterium 32-64-17]